jgi:light-regulated signal transduction histidine kinase (bacteriophytochrome)
MNRDLERRIAERTAELATANRHLEAFSYSVSHDLRAPLRAIQGFGAALAEDSGPGLGDQGRAHLERVLGSARHMEELLEGLLSMGRTVSGEVRRIPVDVTALARDVVQEIQHGDPERSVELAIHEGLEAMADPVLLRAVLVNLIGNAWKFTSKRAVARIEVGRQAVGPPLVFFVRDNGAGFDMQDAQKLFGVFRRLHRYEDFPGTGVGLATVERIVASHGGRIWAEAAPDAGATFFFTLG